MTDSIYNNAGMPSEQGAAPEIPEDLRGTYQTMQMRSEQSVIHVRPRVITEFIERIAALTLERDTLKRQSDKWMIDFGIECAKNESLTAERNMLKAERDERAEQVRRYDKAIGVLTEDNAALKAKVERLSAPVSDEEIPEHQWREWLHRDKGVPWRMGPSASSAHPEFEQMLNEGWEIVTVSNSFTLLHRIAARASAPPTPLVFTCPFDGEVWRFHTQEQLDRLWKHLEWHATNINSKEYPS